MRFLHALLCLFAVAPLFSEDAIPAIASPETPWWGQALVAVIGLLVAFFTKWLHTAFKVKTEQTQLDSTKSLMEQRNFIIDTRLIPFAVSTAEHWMTLKLPVLLLDATDGNGFDWSKHWGDLKSYAKTRVKEKFLSENMDILQILGEKELDNLLDRLLLKLISKLPDNVKAFLPEPILDKLTDYATAFIVSKGKDLLGMEK